MYCKCFIAPPYLPPIHSQLMSLGWSKEDITHQVKEKAMCESESIYGTLYGTLGEDGVMEEEP